MSIEFHLQAFVTVVSLINPGTCSIMFGKAEVGRTLSQKLKDATYITLAVLITLSLAAIYGRRILEAFGVSLDAFSVAGGLVLVWMGFAMMGAFSKQNSDNEGTAQTPSLTPIILFAASPGTITGVITLAVHHTRLGLPWTALVAVATASGFAWLLLALAAVLGERGQRDSLVRETFQAFMGLIIIAMGVQFGLTGIKHFLAAG